MENQNNIDKLFSDLSTKAEEDTRFPAFEKVWGKVEYCLDKKERKANMFSTWLPYGIAASFALIFVSLYLFDLNDKIPKNRQIAVNIPSKNIQNSEEKYSAKSSDDIEKLNQKIKENIVAIPLETNEIIAYQNPKTMKPENDFEKKINLPSESVAMPAPVQNIENKVYVSKKMDVAEKDIAVSEVMAGGYVKDDTKSMGLKESKSEISANAKLEESEINSEKLGGKAEAKTKNVSAETSLEPLYIIDGYFANSDFLKNYDVKNIYSLNVIEGKNAEKLYGNYGKKRVVVITTKGLRKKEESQLRKISEQIEMSKKEN